MDRIKKELRFLRRSFLFLPEKERLQNVDVLSRKNKSDRVIERNQRRIAV